jgi:hypothetical protein
MKSRTISRRTFLHLGAASGAAAVLAACGQAAPSTGPAAPAEAPAPAAPAASAERMGSGGYYEAPMWPSAWPRENCHPWINVCLRRRWWLCR